MESVVNKFSSLSLKKALRSLQIVLGCVEREKLKNKLIVLYSKHNGDLEAMSESLTDNTHIVTPSELRLFFKTFELETVIQ